jgi:hypothetical protein
MVVTVARQCLLSHCRLLLLCYLSSGPLGQLGCTLDTLRSQVALAENAILNQMDMHQHLELTCCSNMRSGACCQPSLVQP